MNTRSPSSFLLLIISASLICVNAVFAADWSQWRGSNRDGVASGFSVPTEWPAELSQKWIVEVGAGVSTPAIVDGKLFAFALQEGQEVTYCIDAESGEVAWKAAYDSEPITGPAGQFPGPRSSPAVGDGKVVTLGVNGLLSCMDAATGEVLWRKDEFVNTTPGFYTSASPMIVDGMCIAQIGGQDNGGIFAFDLDSGDETWKWTGDGPSYGSPVLATIDGVKVVVAPTNGNLAVLSVSDGSLLLQKAHAQGRYNAATPILDGQSLYVAGPARGMSAMDLVTVEEGLATKPLWSNPENSVQFNSPIFSGGYVYGISNRNELFAINATTGSTAWKSQIGSTPVAPEPPQGGRQMRRGPGGEGGPAGGPRGGERMRRGDGQGQGPGGGGQVRRREGQGGGPGGARMNRGQGGGRRGGGGARPGFGSVVAVGDVLFAITPTSELVVTKPNEDGAVELARYKLSDKQTYAQPVVAGNLIVIKDQDSVRLYTLN